MFAFTQNANRERKEKSLQPGDLLVEQIRQVLSSYGVTCFNVDAVPWAISSYRPTLWLVPLAHKVANRCTTSCTLVLVLVFPESS